MSATATAWAEYLAFTRGADPWQYEETEERAWRRLIAALPAEALPVPEPEAVAPPS